MAVIRLSPTEVIVGDIKYTFRTPEEADRFESCVSDGHDAEVCADITPPIAQDKWPPAFKPPTRSEIGDRIKENREKADESADRESEPPGSDGPP
jgi:hypothetical protein